MYRIELIQVAWGDYGEILHHGISWNRNRVNGLIQLERTGPFIAPLTLPSTNHVVVTEWLREAIRKSELTGYRFLPVVKARIVRLEWHSWNPKERPAKFPAGGEPENYVLRRKHHTATAEELGPLWELSTEVAVPLKKGKPSYLLVAGHEEDFFRDEDELGVYVSARARQWLEETVGKCVGFKETLIA